MPGENIHQSNNEHSDNVNGSENSSSNTIRLDHRSHSPRKSAPTSTMNTTPSPSPSPLTSTIVEESTSHHNNVSTSNAVPTSPRNNPQRPLLPATPTLPSSSQSSSLLSSSAIAMDHSKRATVIVYSPPVRATMLHPHHPNFTAFAGANQGGPPPTSPSAPNGGGPATLGGAANQVASTTPSASGLLMGSHPSGMMPTMTTMTDGSNVNLMYSDRETDILKEIFLFTINSNPQYVSYWQHAWPTSSFACSCNDLLTAVYQLDC
jgi:hypothetical protein